jgi:dTDP-4-amino-4,6-dideoxygalactose transaminase
VKYPGSKATLANQLPIQVAAPQVGEREVAAVRDVLLSGAYVSGRRVKDFERRFAEYIGVEHAVAVNSGTAALHIALQAMGVGPGDEVIVPPLTFFATVSCVLYVGATPVFADIDRDDWCISPRSVARAVTPRTKAIIPVHLFGMPAKMDALIALAQQHGMAILEDCAQAHGSAYRGKRVGGFGRAGAFSFFATKHMTTGEGGMITTNDGRLAETARIIRNHGMIDRDRHVVLGFNHRMTEMAAALGTVQIEKLDALNAARIAHSKQLLSAVCGLPWAGVPEIPPDVKHTFFWCPLTVSAEETGKTIAQLKDHLKRHRIGFRQRYQAPLYRQPVLKALGFDFSGLNLVNAESVAGKIIGLPNHPGLTQRDIDRIVAVLNAF